MPNKTHTLVQFTDTHLTGDELLYGVVDPAANLQAAIDHAAQHVNDADALLFTGDLANAGQPAAYQQLRSIIDEASARFGIPAWVGIGNHDQREPFRAGLLGGQPAPDNSVPAPYATDGDGAPIDYRVDIGGLRLLMLDSTVPGYHHGQLERDQFDWLRAELEAHDNGSAVVALHHPPMASQPSGDMVALAEALRFEGLDQLAAVVGEHPVSMVLAGHFHDPRGSRLGTTSVWAGPATAMTHGVDLDAELFKIIESIGYSVIEIFDDGTAVASAIDVTANNVLAALNFADLAKAVEELTAS